MIRPLVRKLPLVPAMMLTTGVLMTGSASAQPASGTAAVRAPQVRAVEPGEGSLETTPERVRAIQQQLKALGFRVGAADGVYGEQTASALREFQRSQGLRPYGVIDRDTLSALGVDDAPAAVPPR